MDTTAAGRKGEANRAGDASEFVAIGNKREMWGDATESLTRSILDPYTAFWMFSTPELMFYLNIFLKMAKENFPATSQE